MNLISIYIGEQLCPKKNKWVLRVYCVNPGCAEEKFMAWFFSSLALTALMLSAGVDPLPGHWGLLCRLHTSGSGYTPGELWCLDGAGMGTICTEPRKYSSGGTGEQVSG